MAAGLASLAEALAAGVGGVVCTAVLYPLELVKNKLQVATAEDRGPGEPAPTFLGIAARVWRADGARGLYWGRLVLVL